jgi:hypothetical protein
MPKQPVEPVVPIALKIQSRSNESASEPAIRPSLARSGRLLVLRIGRAPFETRAVRAPQGERAFKRGSL